MYIHAKVTQHCVYYQVMGMFEKKKIGFHNILDIGRMEPKLCILTSPYFSMTTLLTHTVAHSTKPTFRSKTNNQPLKKFLSLALS